MFIYPLFFKITTFIGIEVPNGLGHVQIWLVKFLLGLCKNICIGKDKIRKMLKVL